jgi:23S rRNA pseudouridine2605 synthase
VERLQKVLSKAGVASRRKAEVMIAEGLVRVNGEVVTTLGSKVDPERDRIEVGGEPIRTETHVYFLFHKPRGVITSVRDPQGRKVVLDYFSHIRTRIYPVGRLDYDTSGLLLLTNDGELAHKLMHPSFHIEKTYIATVQGFPSREKLQQLRAGVHLKDGLTAPAQVQLLSRDEYRKEAKVKLTITEGRKRQVRRMFAYLHHPVNKLHRVQYAFLTLEGVQEGAYRRLTRIETDRLKAL